MADRNGPPPGWPPADDPYAYGAPPPQYAEGTYDQLNFRNPGHPPDHPDHSSGRAAVPIPPQPAQPRQDARHHEQHQHVGAGLAEGEYVHSHVHSATNPVSERTRKAVIAILVPAVLATIVGLILLWPGQIHYSSANQQSAQQQRAEGTVTQVVEQSCPQTSEADAGSITGPCGTATVKVTDGTGQGDTVSMELPQGPGSPSVHVDDKVVLLVIAGTGDNASRYTIVDKQRAGSLWLLVALSAAVVIAFGRIRGLAAIGGLIVSFAVLLLFVIPGILGGSPPLLVAVVGSAAIMFAVLYLTHGVSVRTSVAILGTLASLVLTGLLGAGFTALTELTGLGDESSVYLSTVEGGVDMRGLLLAGIIIGSLGVLDDVTVTQAEVVAELARTPRSRFDLYRAAIRVGRAHVGSAVNTIVLAYAGASLPLLLLISVSGQSLGSLVTGQSIASEIVRSLVGTIGLVASVPITTALAALVAEPPLEDE
ncbi:YibE/F family protein [Cryptosporangium phraense]|uniref:YibE/F family protein n=1 Tax=Cryptosporangium phraense TaxID=2593070 RepID=A0A545AHR4_9ACTN|nr:YibE/F family protein [Cryptosporangium phraense]TQS40856.1 YibE/F family protein [Cryptosporangium phraense]